MSTNTSLAGFAVRRDLVAALQALNSSAWTVFNGNTPSGESPATYVVIGSNSDGEVMTLGQSWHSLGGQAERDNDGVIMCFVGAWSGDPAEAAACLDRVEGCIADVDATARQLSTAPIVSAMVTAATVRQSQMGSGVEVRADVEVSFTAVLTTWP